MTKTWRSGDFVQLRKLYKNGESMKDIAKILNSTSSTVSAYISNEISFSRLNNRNKKKEVKLKWVIFHNTSYYPAVVGEYNDYESAKKAFDQDKGHIYEEDELFLCEIKEKVSKYSQTHGGKS